MKNRMFATLAVIVAVFVNLEALLRHWGVEAAAVAQLNRWGVAEADFRGHSVNLALAAVACALLGRVISGRWMASISVALLAFGAAQSATFNLWALVLAAIVGAEIARELRRDYGLNRLWSRILVLASFTATCAGAYATVPMAKFSWAVGGATVIVLAGTLQHLFSLDKPAAKPE